MAREFDPINLAAGDVLRIAAPTIAVIALLVLVGKFAPDYVWLLIVLLAGGAYSLCFEFTEEGLSCYS